MKVHDFTNDKAIHNAKVSYFQLLDSANKFIEPADYDYKCDISKYREFAGMKQNFQTAFTRTNN